MGYVSLLEGMTLISLNSLIKRLRIITKKEVVHHDLDTFRLVPVPNLILML